MMQDGIAGIIHIIHIITIIDRNDYIIIIKKIHYKSILFHNYFYNIY